MATTTTPKIKDVYDVTLKTEPGIVLVNVHTTTQRTDRIETQLRLTADQADALALQIIRNSMLARQEKRS